MAAATGSCVDIISLVGVGVTEGICVVRHPARIKIPIRHEQIARNELEDLDRMVMATKHIIERQDVKLRWCLLRGARNQARMAPADCLMRNASHDILAGVCFERLFAEEGRTKTRILLLPVSKE